MKLIGLDAATSILRLQLGVAAQIRLRVIEGDGTVRALAGRDLAFAVYRATISEVVAATISSDSAGDFADFLFPGDFLAPFENVTQAQYQLTDNGFPWIAGTVIIDPGLPGQSGTGSTPIDEWTWDPEARTVVVAAIGAPGLLTTLEIGAVTALAPGTPPAASIAGIGPVQTLNLGIPTGLQGAPGVSPVLTFGAVTTLAPGQPATVAMTGTSANPIVSLGIPMGMPGAASSVASVSVAGANGIVATITNPTTAPAISLALGAVTPSSVSTATVTFGRGAAYPALCAIGADGASIGIGNGVLNGGAATGAQNTAFGTASMALLTTGAYNVAFGHGALGQLTTGTLNCCVGRFTGYALTTGGNNVLLGNGAGQGLVANANNTMVGTAAGQQVTTGSYNTLVGPYIGVASMDSQVILSDGHSSVRYRWDGTLSNLTAGAIFLPTTVTGQYNIFIGRATGGNLTSGQLNTSMGSGAGNSLTTGGSNLLLGQNAGGSITTGNFNTVVGMWAGAAAANNNVVLADGQGNVRFQHDGTNTLLGSAGSFVGVNVAAPSAPLHVGCYGYNGLRITGSALGSDYSPIIDLNRYGSAANTGMQIGADTFASNRWFVKTLAVGDSLAFSVDGNSALGVTVKTGSGALVPNGDNTIPMGSSSARFSTIYAGTGSINTSDATMKTVRSTPVTDQEKAWAMAISALPFQFNDSIAEKGADKARTHWGVIAQDVAAAGTAAGITNPMDYAFLCQDALLMSQTTTESIEVQRQVVAPALVTQTTISVVDGRAVQTTLAVTEDQPVFDDLPVFDADGGAVMLNSDTQLTYRAPRMETVTVSREETTQVPQLNADGSPVMRWGIRYDELVMFLLACGRL